MAMVYPMQADEVDRRQKLLSNHIETWGAPRIPGDGWSQLSMDSSEMGELASPFDDIGFLAGGAGPAMDPPSPKRSADKSRNVSDQVSTATPSLGKFLDDKQQNKPTPVDDQSRLSSLSQRGSRRRLDKTLSTRQQFQHDEEASLALSAAIAAGDKTKAIPSRNLFDFSKQSLGLSVLASSKTKSKAPEISKSSFDTSRTLSTKSSTKGNDSSKGSFGFGASRTSTEPSRKLGSKFTSMMRSKTESDKLSKSEQKVSTLEAENVELHKEVNLLQAKLDEMANMIAAQTILKEWRSTEELAVATTESWQFRSMAILAGIQRDRLEAKLAAQDRLIEAKERSICNLESVRQEQEKRIGYLEMQCLQNGIDIAEDGDCARVEEDVPLKSGYSAGSRSDDNNEGSFASFHDDTPFQAPIEVPFNIPYPPPRPDNLNRSNRSESSHKERDVHARSTRSDCSSSMCLSEMSFHSQTDDDDPEPPESQRDVDDYPSRKIKAVPLEKFLSTNVPRQHCFETGTWDPTKTLDFANSSPRDVGIVMPPPPPPTADHVHSAPGPSDRKKADGAVVISRSSRSKSPGTRRRLKATKVENDEDVPTQSIQRSKSPRTRRKLKDPTTGAGGTTTTIPAVSSSNTLDGAQTEHCKISRRKLKAHKSDIGPSSTHSLSRGSAHRRRQRKESEFDRLTVSSALEKALGESMNVLDMEDEFATVKVQDIKAGNASSSKLWKRDNGILMVQSKASRESDFGLDLDAVYRD